MNEQCRWVLDTNVLISRLLAPGGVAARAADLALARGVLPLSEATLEKMIAVLGRSKFDPYIRR
jgi:predicted nucleic acid-binding protein